MDKQCAVEIRGHALKAIAELSQLLVLSKSKCTSDKFEQIRQGVGMAIGEIQMGILEGIIADFPELDDLN